MLIGAGTFGAEDAVIQGSRDILGAGIAKALLGKAVLPDDLPYVTQGRSAFWAPSRAGLNDEQKSVISSPSLMVGSGPYSEFLPEEGKARGVQIEIVGRMVGIRYPMEVKSGRRRGRYSRGS